MPPQRAAIFDRRASGRAAHSVLANGTQTHAEAVKTVSAASPSFVRTAETMQSTSPAMNPMGARSWDMRSAGSGA